MAAGGGGSDGGGGGRAASPPRELDFTPTWAVSTVCGVIIVLSIFLENLFHVISKWFERRRKKALVEALQKVKNELMVLGFISLLLSFCQSYIASICVPLDIVSGWTFCDPNETENEGKNLLQLERRVLAADAVSPGCERGHLPLISVKGLHQLHIFIFFLAIFHVFYSALTMMLGRAKMRRWKLWEREFMNQHETLNDPMRFRLSHETSFVREHITGWTQTKFSFYVVCFFRQFIRSVRKADYLTLRHGFVSVHLAPGMKFNFQKYIKRSLEDDFKVVVGVRPSLWGFAMSFLLVDIYGWHATAVLTLLPPLVTLAVGTKLQAIISKMAFEIEERQTIIQGMPLVQVSDRHFWFGSPNLVLILIHFVLFQNAFEITYFFWIWYEFGLRSCFHHNMGLAYARVSLGVAVQIICSYITLPLYALVSQMGSTMKQTVFDEQTSRALKQWHKDAKMKNWTKAGQYQSKNLTDLSQSTHEHSSHDKKHKTNG